MSIYYEKYMYMKKKKKNNEVYMYIEVCYMQHVHVCPAHINTHDKVIRVIKMI
jgi:hypothetical protein